MISLLCFYLTSPLWRWERELILSWLFEFSAPLVTHWTPLSTLDLHTRNLQRKSSWDRSTIEMTTTEVRSAQHATNECFRTTFLNSRLVLLANTKLIEIHRDLKWIKIHLLTTKARTTTKCLTDKVHQELRMRSIVFVSLRILTVSLKSPRQRKKLQ